MDPLIETERTLLRLPSEADAPFILELLNEPLLVHHTGDRGIRTLEAATAYITDKLLAQHEALGFTLWVVERKTDHTPIGINGLVQRAYLDAPDIGFGFLERHCGQGYGTETAQAVMSYSRQQLGLYLIYGITSSGNHASIRLLRKLGMHHTRVQKLPGIERLQRIYQYGS